MIRVIPGMSREIQWYLAKFEWYSRRPENWKSLRANLLKCLLATNWKGQIFKKDCIVASARLLRSVVNIVNSHPLNVVPGSLALIKQTSELIDCDYILLISTWLIPFEASSNARSLRNIYQNAIFHETAAAFRQNTLVQLSLHRIQYEKHIHQPEASKFAKIVSLCPCFIRSYAWEIYYSWRRYDSIRLGRQRFSCAFKQSQCQR